MEIMQYLIKNFSASENLTIAIVTVCIVLYFIISLIKWTVLRRSDIKSLWDNMYTHRQVREEMVKKINTGYKVSRQNLNDIQMMKNDYAGYREQSIKIQNELTNMLNILDEKMNTATEKSEALNQVVLGIRDALIEIMNGSITQKCNYYYQIGGIPENEVEDFQRMFDVYNAIGGNHGLEARFEKTKTELPLIPIGKLEE